MKTKSSLIILLLVLVGIVAVSGCTDNNNSTESNESENNVSASNTYFEVMGNATVVSDVSAQVPVRKTVNQTVYFYYTPYVDGVPQTGSWCVVPNGIDTTKKFMLSINDPDIKKYDSIDIYVSSDENGQNVLQKINVKL